MSKMQKFTMEQNKRGEKENMKWSEASSGSDTSTAIILGVLSAIAIIILLTLAGVPSFQNFNFSFSNGTSTKPLPVYHYENMTAIIENKFTSTVWHNMIIGRQFVSSFDTQYNFFMNTNETITVLKSEYDSHNIGDNFTYIALR